jgi:hypothetical protein
MAGAKDLSPLQSIHTASEAHPITYPTGNGVYFSGVKLPELSWPLANI